MVAGMHQADLSCVVMSCACVCPRQRYTGITDLYLCTMTPSLLAELCACAFCVKQDHQALSSFCDMPNSCEVRLSPETDLINCHPLNPLTIRRCHHRAGFMLSCCWVILVDHFGVGWYPVDEPLEGAA